MTIQSIILAAGQGTRMRSNLPKVLHPLLGRPLVFYSLETSAKVTGTTPVMVIGHGGEEVRQVVGEAVNYVLQERQLGTGHAVQQTMTLLQGQSDQVLVTYADMPLLREETFERLVDAHKSHQGPITMLTVVEEDPRGFGRIVRSKTGEVIAIVEESEATPDQLKIHELNASVYCFDAVWLWNNIQDIPISNKGEYFLTDLVEMAVNQGLPVQALILEDNEEAIGINTRVHLAEAEAILRKRINRQWMLAGVTLIDPASSYIEPGVTIGQDTIIWPNSYLQGSTTIGENCTIGPNTIIKDTRVGSRCEIVSSVVDRAVIEDEVDIGPFAHLRKGAHLAKGVHLGNFGEIKNSYLAPGVKMGHFSYVGDADIGRDTNIGAGTITCNFDGKNKHKTIIGKDAFIGSDTMLIAPLKIGDGARTGAGAVVRKDVPDYTLAVGLPARNIKKLEKSD
jgi:bifunctional UDP-N-acetylglucosamine pyrophosphorylase / glucosamine-1-phosphate N-acetyltransferase